ncbi:MAG: beta-1,6-N-acetylglucosaminyltransferase [Brevinemataceae bacterium]
MREIVIFWKISAYKNPEIVLYLIEYILNNTQNDRVFLHWDKNSSKKVFETLQNSLKKYGNRVYCFQKYPTSWGSIDIVRSELFLTQCCVENDLSYDYSINLTGDSFFLKSFSQLREFLNENYGKTFLDHVYDKNFFLSLEDNKEKHYQGILRGVGTFYQKFFAFNNELLQRINPHLTWAELSRILIHFTPFKIYPKNKIKRFCYKVCNRLVEYYFKLYSKIFGVTLIPLAIPNDLGTRLSRASMHIVSFYKTDQMLYEKKTDIYNIIKKMKYMFAQDEIIIPSFILSEINESLLVKNPQLGLHTHIPLDSDKTKLLAVQNRFFGRKFISIEDMKNISQYINRSASESKEN